MCFVKYNMYIFFIEKPTIVADSRRVPVEHIAHLPAGAGHGV